MTSFDAMNIAGTGMSTMTTWLDALSNNIANVNTVEPTSGPAFQATYIEAQAIPGAGDGSGGGVEITAQSKGSATGRMTYSPNDPQADKNGYVRMPDIDMGEQMGNLIIAQRGFQANAAVIDRAKTVYEAAINIGKSN